MDTVASALLQEVDPRILGSRLRAARLARGWTQTDLAGELCSVGYVSRLESGQRRPIASVLDGLAAKLEIAVDELLRGPTARQQDEIKLQLDYAELSLGTGDTIEAEAKAREARDRAQLLSQTALADRATFLIALALETQGSLDDAILELEPLVAQPAGGVQRIHAAIALSRCLRESGDLHLAIAAGEQLLAELAGTALDQTDEAVQLAVTLAAAYHERGDIGQAVRACRKAIDKAEKLDSAQARASAYWNASMMEAKKGQVADAVPLAERALALLSEGQDARNLARLRSVLADMQLQLDPPLVSAAQENLSKAEEELLRSSASAVDLARNKVFQAQATLLEGNFAGARELAQELHDQLESSVPDLAAHACTIQGQAEAALGEIGAAAETYRRAVLLLTGMGADRSAAQLWFELAGLLETVGDLQTARTAYRSAAASVGLRSRPTLGASRQDAIDLASADQLTID